MMVDENKVNWSEMSKSLLNKEYELVTDSELVELLKGTGIPSNLVDKTQFLLVYGYIHTYIKNNGTLNTIGKLCIMFMNWKSFLILDVRNNDLDFIGGHIKNAMNISYHIFESNMPQIINKYNNFDIIIIHCMHSQYRAPKCCDLYCVLVNVALHLSQHNTTNIKIKKYYNNFLNKNKTYKKLFDQILVLNQDEFNNLRKQKIMLLEDGFQNFVSKYHKSIELIQNFDPQYWNLKENRLYHKYDNRSSCR
eukprot:380038_1